MFSIWVCTVLMVEWYSYKCLKILAFKIFHVACFLVFGMLNVKNLAFNTWYTLIGPKIGARALKEAIVPSKNKMLIHKTFPLLLKGPKHHLIMSSNLVRMRCEIHVLYHLLRDCHISFLLKT